MIHNIKIYIELDRESYVYLNEDLTRSIDIDEKIKQIEVYDKLSKLLGISCELRIVKLGTFETLHKLRYTNYVDPGSITIPRMMVDKIDIDVVRDSILFMY